jgi:ABC-2 type transport system permease protein
LPVSAWFLLISAWANRAVTLWALVAPAVVCFVEIKLLGTRYLMDALGARFFGYLKTAFRDAEQYRSLSPDGGDFTVPRITWRLIDPASFFSSVEMWVGVALGVAFVAGAIYLRQRRTEA